MSGVIVVKYGGSAMEDPAKVSEILKEIAGLAKEGFPMVLVHGGGEGDQRGDGSERDESCLCPRVQSNG